MEKSSGRRQVRHGAWLLENYRTVPGFSVNRIPFFYETLPDFLRDYPLLTDCQISIRCSSGSNK